MMHSWCDSLCDLSYNFELWLKNGWDKMWRCVLRSEVGEEQMSPTTGQVTDIKQCPKPWAEPWPGVPAAMGTQWHHQASGTARVASRG